MVYRGLSLIVMIGTVFLFSYHPGYASFEETHPRLFFQADDIPTLHEQAVTTHQDIWVSIQLYLDEQSGVLPPLTAPVDADEAIYRAYGNQIIPFAFACGIAGLIEACESAKTYLLIYAGWQQWGERNRRDLGLAHMLVGNALAYDWVYTYLSPEEQQTVRESLLRWTERMYEASSQPYQDEWTNWWTSSYWQNHHWTNNSALGMAALALLTGDSDVDINTRRWLDQAVSQISTVQYILTQVHDGTWYESISYQNYALTMMLPFLVNLRRIEGIDLFPHEYLQNLSTWRLFNYLPGTSEAIMAFGDFEPWWGNSYNAQNILRFVANEYDDPTAAWLAQEVIAQDGRGSAGAPWAAFEFFYYDPTLAPQPPSNPPLAYVFPDLEAVIWRTGWQLDDMVFGLKTGAYGGRFGYETFTQQLYPWQVPCSATGCNFNTGHNHADANTFYLFRAGAWLAPEREGIQLHETSYHNTLLIDGQGQYFPIVNDYPSPESFAGSDGFLEATANTPNFNYVAADATQPYAKMVAGLRDYTRYVVFIRPDYFVMVDNIVSDTPHQYTWVSHAGGAISVETQDRWIRADAAEGDQTLGVGVVLPQAFNVTTGDDGRPYFHIQPDEAQSNERFINLLFPTDDGQWNDRPTFALLHDSQDSVFLQITKSTGAYDDVLLSFEPADAYYDAVQYAFDGQVAVMMWRSDGTLERLFSSGGTFVTDQLGGVTYVSNLHGTEPFEAVFDGPRIAVYGNIVSRITLYAPDAVQLTLNGQDIPFFRNGDYIEFGLRDSAPLSPIEDL